MKFWIAAATLLWLAGCSKSNNLLLGRVQATVGTHTVVVTDCYRTNPPGPERVTEGVFHYMPCRDADVWIRAGEVTVNGRAYGRVNPRDSVLVDHGVVSIERN
jgi:hypothetical protein